MKKPIQVRRTVDGTEVSLTVGDEDHSVRLEVTLGADAVRTLISELEDAIKPRPRRPTVKQ